MSPEQYLFVLCNNGCGFLDLRFCLLKLLPEDFLQLGIEGEELLHKETHNASSDCSLQALLCLQQSCSFFSLTSSSSDMSDSLSVQILIILSCNQEVCAVTQCISLPGESSCGVILFLSDEWWWKQNSDLLLVFSATAGLGKQMLALFGVEQEEDSLSTITLISIKEEKK